MTAEEDPPAKRVTERDLEMLRLLKRAMKDVEQGRAKIIIGPRLQKFAAQADRNLTRSNSTVRKTLLGVELSPPKSLNNPAPFASDCP